MSERYLLVQLADIGDLVLTTPAIAALREAHPRARIDLYASEYALPLLTDNLVDTLIPLQKQRPEREPRIYFAGESARAGGHFAGALRCRCFLSSLHIARRLAEISP